MTSTAKTDASSETSCASRLRARVPWGSKTSGAPDLHETAGRTGDRAPDEEEVSLEVDLMHDETRLRDAGTAHAAGHLHPLEDPRRIGRRTDRARLAHVVRAVRDSAAVNPWRLMVPWNPLPIEMPETLISSPGSNASTVTVSPTASPLSPRSSTM